MRFMVAVIGLAFGVSCKQSAEFQGSSVSNSTAPAPSNEANGNEGDSGSTVFDERVAREGGQSGVIQASLVWDTSDDLDIYAVGPSNEVIYFRTPKDRAGGYLDIDMNADPTFSKSPVENVFWSKAAAEGGKYNFYVNFYELRSGDRSVPYKVRIKAGGQQKVLSGTALYREQLPSDTFQNFDIIPVTAKLVHQLNFRP